MDLTLDRRLPVPARLPRPVVLSLGVVVLLHAAVLLRQQRESTWRGPAPAMQVRMVHAAPSARQGPVPAPVAAEVPAALPQVEPEPESDVPSLASVAAAALWLPTLTGFSSPPAADDAPAPAADDIYHPRSELTTPPSPIVTIQVMYPPAFEDKGDYSVQLSLFIDETGRVRRVRVDTLGLPEALQEAASKAFLNAYFEPGKMAGRPVKALMRVEVAFENRPA